MPHTPRVSPARLPHRIASSPACPLPPASPHIPDYAPVRPPPLAAGPRSRRGPRRAPRCRRWPRSPGPPTPRPSASSESARASDGGGAAHTGAVRPARNTHVFPVYSLHVSGGPHPGPRGPPRSPLLSSLSASSAPVVIHSPPAPRCLSPVPAPCCRLLLASFPCFPCYSLPPSSPPSPLTCSYATMYRLTMRERAYRPHGPRLQPARRRTCGVRSCGRAARAAVSFAVRPSQPPRLRPCVDYAELLTRKRLRLSVRGRAPSLPRHAHVANRRARVAGRVAGQRTPMTGQRVLCLHSMACGVVAPARGSVRSSPGRL